MIRSIIHHCMRCRQTVFSDGRQVQVILQYSGKMKRIKSWTLKHEIAVYAFLTLVFLVLRLYKLDEVFAGLHVDEAGIQYDAYCIANYHVDRYLNSFPVYMINYGGGQSALYTYLVAILYKLTGTSSVFLLRLPIVCSNYLLCLCTALLFRHYKGKAAGWTAFLIMMFMPYMMMQSRFALDCNLFVAALSITTLCLVKAADQNRSVGTGSAASQSVSVCIPISYRG